MQEVKEYMEPVLVRHGEKYPEEDHMYTYLTFAILCDKTPAPEALKAVRKFRFDKGYKFSMRGHAEARLVVADMNGRTSRPTRRSGALEKCTGRHLRRPSGGKRL